nr:integrase, catalytic region, zinc finger, CCHC-type, peptidase aspartic, catalytic [Tanacetum cinerariifolium]
MCEMFCQFIQKKQEEKQIEEEQAAKAQNSKICVCYDDDDDYNSTITPNEPVDSLSMGDEHLDTISATELDKFIKSCVENLVPNPKKIFSNPLLEEEIIYMKIDPHHFNAEFDLIESLLSHDSSIIPSSSKIDSLLDEFAGELTLLKSIPSPLVLKKWDVINESDTTDDEAGFTSFSTSVGGGNQLEDEDSDFYDGYEDQVVDLHGALKEYRDFMLSMSGLFVKCTYVIQICLWCVDSGCSKHMTGNLKLLINFFWKFLGTVRFENDHIAVILGFDDLQWGNILITRVYFVEGLGHNLFSVGQFCDSDLEVAFRRNACFVRNLEGVDLLSGNRTTNLYTINLHDMASASPICLMARASSTKSWLWHQRKSKRASHPPKTVPNSRQMLHLLHMDLCGLMRISSINGKRYVLEIVDDYSRYTWRLLLRVSLKTAPSFIIDFNKTPYERINDRKPDISFLHVLGLFVIPRMIVKILGSLAQKVILAFSLVILLIPVLSEFQNPGFEACLLDKSVQDSILPMLRQQYQLNNQLKATNFPNTSHDVDGLTSQQQHAQLQGNQASLQPETIADNVTNAMFDENSFVNPFANPSTSAAESSSSQYAKGLGFLWVRVVEGHGDSDSLMEEVDLFLTPDDPMPPSIEDDDDDSERDILILEELLDNYSISLPEHESFYFDIPLFSRPLAKPPDGNTGILNIKMMGGNSEQKVPIPRLMITLVSNQEKSPDLLAHRSLENFQLYAKCPMMIHGKNIHILDVPLFHFYPLDQLKYEGNWVKLSDLKQALRGRHPMLIFSLVFSNEQCVFAMCYCFVETRFSFVSCLVCFVVILVVQYSRKLKDSCQRILSSKSSFPQLQLGIHLLHLAGSQPMLKSSYQAENGVIISIPPLVGGVTDVVVEIKGTDIQCASSDTRPPMLDRTDFASWQQRIRMYCRSKKNGLNILKSIDEGPFQMGIFRETLAEGTEGGSHLGLERPRVYSDLSPEEKDRMQLNSKFVNNMLPEWGGFVTTIKLNRGLRDSNYDQFYAYLKQHEAHANENKMMLDRFTQHTVDPLALMSNVSHQQHYSQSSTTPPSTYIPPHLTDIAHLDSGQARQTKCYNYNGLGHIARNCTQPKRPQNSDYFKDKMLLMQAQENEVASDEDKLLFLSVGQDNAVDEDAPTAQTMFMVNLSSADPVYDEVGPLYDSDILSEARCLKLEAELSNLRDKIHNDNYNELLNQFSNLEVHHLNLQLKYQNLKVSFRNNPPTPAKDTPNFDSVFVIRKMQASLQGKDNVIKQLKNQISHLQETRSEADRNLDFRALESQITQLTEKVTVLQDQNDMFRAENEKIKQHYKELYDSIKITHTKHIEQTTALTTENVNLKAQILNNVNSVIKDHVKPTVLAPGKYVIDVEPIPPRLRNNKEAHLNYLRRLKESVETIYEIVEKAKVKTNVPVPPSTGVNRCIDASGLQPRSNTKKSRISPAKEDRSWLMNFVKKFIETVRFGNDHFGAIMGYGDYVIGDSVIFRHSCYVRDMDGVELIKGSRGSNLYTISVEDMMKSSPICLLSKASKNKSWLWHKHLNHLNFGTINDLARKDLVR